jgi:hypothetical protein
MAKLEGTMCMCITYHAVHTITIKGRYLLSHIDDLLNPMNGSRCCTTLNLAAGMRQIRIAAADRQTTAFATKYGWYGWVEIKCGSAEGTGQKVIPAHPRRAWVCEGRHRSLKKNTRSSVHTTTLVAKFTIGFSCTSYLLEPNFDSRRSS